MDENQQAVSQASEENKQEENLQVESPTTEQTLEEEAELTGEPSETSGKGASQRIRELNQRAKTAETQVKSLQDKIAELTGSVEPKGFNAPQFNPQEPIVKEGEEIDVAELNRRIADREQRLMQQTEARIELRSRQSEAISRHRNETAEVMREYSQLDPRSNDFDSELSEMVTEAVEAKLKADPYSTSVKKFVDKLMRPYNRAVAKEAGQATEKIAKQVTEAAIRPTSIRKGEKTASEKSIAELEAQLGIVHS